MKRRTAERRGEAEVAGVRENGDSNRGRSLEESARRYLQHRLRRRRRTVKLPATLQEKRGTLRQSESSYFGRNHYLKNI
ncbi:hypothetical protein NDU88_005609 [Pleurodeles waltl]|uniref:Uncharacterized protein n=1 Tax=Pleurodeles waltl TaxID=8319 RepID=A0AAV7PFW2_PLEWA|nr:hypothetical protein NDU88_005609 [Pleurodeles waltl]